jgi:nitrate reductase NapE component
VAKPDVLARAKQDLVQGHTYVATRRLRAYLANDPNNLEVRRVLAAIYRQTGNLVEAGRWGFLTAEVTPAELVAFERANPSPFLRLRLLHFTADPRKLPPSARDRLRVLEIQADRVGPPPDWVDEERPAPKPRRNTVPCLFVVIALTVFLALAAVGIYRVVTWLIQL